MVNLPQHPQRDSRAPLHPRNVYGECQHPVDQLQDIESAFRWWQTVGEASRPQQMDTPDHIPSGFPNTSATPSEEDVQKMCEEGGANLVHFLMGKALTTQDPQTKNVWNWSYKDIAHSPQAEQKLWRLTCQEELNVLHKCKVFELVDCPRDWKVIKNWWVFNVKLDGRKKAHLVAKGFSQVEGLDFDQVFSPVVHFETVCLMLVLAMLENWYITGLDVWSAYLYGKLDKEIYGANHLKATTFVQIFLSHKKDPIKIEGANFLKMCEIGQKGVITKYNVFPSILVNMLCNWVPPDKGFLGSKSNCNTVAKLYTGE